MSSERIECGGLMERGGLCLVEVLGFDWRPGETCGILAKFGDAGISLSYLNVGRDARDRRNMVLCVNRQDLEKSRTLLEEIRAEFVPELIEVQEQVVKLTIYGPHFNERYALVAQVFAALCSRGIEARTVGSSVNSISFVVDAVDRELAIGCLREKFAWPE